VPNLRKEIFKTDTKYCITRAHKTGV